VRPAVIVFVLLAAVGCGGSEETVIPPSLTATTPTTEAAPTTTEAEITGPTVELELTEPLPGLPADLVAYQTWSRLNEEPIPPRSSDPHNGTKNVYASFLAETGVYPEGTTIVKEAMRPGTDFIGLIAMMRKEKGAQPDHNDWIWVEYTRSGPDEDFREQASDSACYTCHFQAREADYVFTR
jgi:cytochrome P460